MFLALVGVLLVASYLQVFSLYARQHWTALDLQGAYAHAPLALLIIAYLFWRQRQSLREPLRTQMNPAGLILLAFGVIVKMYGDVQGYIVLQGMSIIPVMLGLIWSYHLTSAARALQFPVLFFFFVVPLPGGAIDALTMPLLELTAEWVSGVLPLFNLASSLIPPNLLLYPAARTMAPIFEIMIKRLSHQEAMA